MRTKFVIAGNYHQAQEWIKKDIEMRKILREVVSMKDYFYVSHAKDIRGIQDPHGVFVGTWRERLDILEILQSLISGGNNPVLINLFNTINAPVKPTPKIRTKTPLLVHINGVLQSENTDYVVGDEFVTFKQAPPAMATVAFQTLVSVTEHTGNGTNNVFRWDNPAIDMIDAEVLRQVNGGSLQERTNQYEQAYKLVWGHHDIR